MPTRRRADDVMFKLYIALSEIDDLRGASATAFGNRLREVIESDHPKTAYPWSPKQIAMCKAIQEALSVNE